MNDFAAIFNHIPHPHTQAHMEGQVPPASKVKDERVGMNGRIGLFITTIVGTMWAAYLFTLLALISFPSAISSGNSIIIVAWVAQTFLQLVLLPVIIVGQNIQAAASDDRAAATYKDAGAILEEAKQIQMHLAAQDAAMGALLDRIQAIEKKVAARG